MKAVVKTRPEPGYVEVKEIPVPQINADEILVKVKATGLCGTDLLLTDWTYMGRSPVNPPITLGHEGAGEVVEVGENVKNFKVGDRVGLEALLGCGHCYHCRRGNPNLCPDWNHLGIDFNGTFAEYIAFPANGAHLLPDSLTYDQAAFLEPISIVVNAFEPNPITVGDTVVIVGPGPLGLFTVQAAKAAGAGKIIVVGTSNDQKRLQLAKELGADYVLDNGENDDAYQVVRELTNGVGAEVVFEAAGSPKSFEQGLKMAAGSGQYIIMGFPKQAEINPLTEIVRQNLTIRGAVGSIPRHYETAIRWLENGTIQIEKMVTQPLSLDEAVSGIQLAKAKEVGKVLFHPEKLSAYSNPVNSANDQTV
ncbi:MAG: alcohol dehydrogenase catalytic domain-containing protein [Bacillota bacterium]|nr:alcohol dehydrogenase catalytic domain-containing protein [Bacillota bacterium]